MFTKNSYSHRRFKLLTQSCISVQYSARPRGIILFSEGQRQQRLHNGFKTFQKSHIQKFQKYFFKLFSLTYTYMYSYYNVQLASIKNISWNYENMVSTSKQIWTQCGYLAGKAHASKRPKLQVLQTTGTFPMIATWFLLAAKTSYYLLGRP